MGSSPKQVRTCVLGFLLTLFFYLLWDGRMVFREYGGTLLRVPPICSRAYLDQSFSSLPVSDQFQGTFTSPRRMTLA